MVVPLSVRNLFESRTRLLVSVGGIGLSMLLILALDGIFAGSMQQVTTYIDETDFDVVIAQDGVKNLHMTTSFFPESVLDNAAQMEGVRDVDRILYSTVFLVSGDDSSLAYLIGYEPGARGGPWETEGVPEELPHGQIIIDEAIGEKHGLVVGDTLTAGGTDYTIGGLTRGTVNVVNSIAFVRYDDYADALGMSDTASYGLLSVEENADASAIAREITRSGAVTAQTKLEFAESEQRIIADMSVDLMRLMNGVAFLIGLVVVALTVHTTTLSKLPELGVLKAVGADSRQLLKTVVAQAYLATGLALMLALLFSLGLALWLRLLGSDIRIAIMPFSVMRVAIAAAAVAAIASAAPIARVARLKPAQVFRR